MTDLIPAMVFLLLVMMPFFYGELVAGSEHPERAAPRGVDAAGLSSHESSRGTGRDRPRGGGRGASRPE